MSEELILKEFKSNLISFIDELIYLFPEERELIILRIKLNDQVPIKNTIDIFNLNINKDGQALKNMIKESNGMFFSNNIFEYFYESNNSFCFKKFWLSSRLDDEDRNTIWKWMESFVFLIDKYNKLK